MNITIREITPADYSVLEDFLYNAIYIPPGEEWPPHDVIFQPEIYIYVDGFGDKQGDIGVVAETDRKIIGAAWARIIPAYGHLDENTPELAISILPEYRGQGIGTLLMEKLFGLLREHGYKRTSLSVQQDNPAVRFYLRLGYVITSEKLDHAGHEDFIMVKELRSMNTETQEKLAGTLSAETTDLLPFLPYLLQDFWELGSDPAVMVKLIKKHVDVSPETRILDLACGKGAVSVKIAEKLRVKIKGIDLFPEFIEYARQKAQEWGVADFCEFAVGDINEAVKTETDNDCVILGAVCDALGSPAETLCKLKSVIKPGGYILIDEGYLPGGAKQSDVKCSHYELFTEAQWMDLFKEADLELAETVGDENNETAASGDSDTGMRFITARANELIEKHTDKREVFERYVRSQQNEYGDLESTLVCVTWILRKN